MDGDRHAPVGRISFQPTRPNCDLFIVAAFKPADGYYKPDVYLYYALTLAIPLFAGWRRTLGRSGTRG